MCLFIVYDSLANNEDKFRKALIVNAVNDAFANPLSSDMFEVSFKYPRLSLGVQKAQFMLSRVNFIIVNTKIESM